MACFGLQRNGLDRKYKNKVLFFLCCWLTMVDVDISTKRSMKSFQLLLQWKHKRPTIEYWKKR